MAASEANQIKTGINILRRMPPGDAEKDLVRLSCLIDPDLEDELWQRVDLPLKIQQDESNGKDFIVCDYNRDGDSHRSPWSNQYFPELEEGLQPTGALRELELKANQIFDVYRRQYYETGVASVYMWELGDSNFAGAFLIHKKVDTEIMKGSWNSINVVEAKRVGGSGQTVQYSYKLTSTVLVNIDSGKEEMGNLNLSGSSSSTCEKNSCEISLEDTIQGHIGNIGPMIEETELKMRNDIQGVYFGRTNAVMCGMRVVDAVQQKAKLNLAAAAMAAQKKKKAAEN